MLNGKTNGKYDTKLRTFAITLHFYSPKAYKYVRSIFHNTLPAVSTIRKWYSSINGKPGFSIEAFDALKAKAAEANKNGTEILVCLAFDEMAIRRQEEFEDHTQEKIGLVNFGTSNINSNTSKYAKEALVFLVTGVNESFKIPVSYFLTNGLLASEKATLIQEVILFVSKTGVKVVGLVFDGLVANLATMRLLGANFRKNRYYIINPHSDDKIFIYLDACHMIKLARNCLDGKGMLYDGDNNCIKWEYLSALEQYQREFKVNLANKVNKTHVQWEKKKMSVRMACETLSNSVADAFDLLRNKGIAAFQGSEATCAYFRRMKNIFKVLNSMKETAIGFKRPISPETAKEFFKFFDDSINYIKGLKLANGKSILKTKSKTPFLGFIMDMDNFRIFYMEYVQSGILPYIITFRFSQDHLELLFACIRQMVRWVISVKKIREKPTIK